MSKRPYGLYYGKLPDEVRARALELAAELLPWPDKVKVRREYTPAGDRAWALKFPHLSGDDPGWNKTMAALRETGLYPDVCFSYNTSVCEAAFIGAVLWKPTPLDSKETT